MTDMEADQTETGRLFGPLVDVAWLAAHLDKPDVHVVDVRAPDDYSRGHIPGAVNIDIYKLKLSSSAPEAIAAFDAQMAQALGALGLQAGDRVVFYEDVSGTSAARGVWLWDYLGLGDSALLDGGLQAWVAAGGEIIRSPSAAVPAELKTTPDRSTLATADQIMAAIRDGSEGVQLIDTRNDLEHLSGTIPGSVHLEWINNLNPDGTFRSVEELSEVYRAAGITRDKETVTYCASGYRAAHTYVALKLLGFPRVRNYAPSWKEWSSRSDVEIAYPDE
jgi:thiosulfate/3-mercaptopyruvate sulfurtransferase